MPQPAVYNYNAVANNTFPFEIRLPFDCTGDDWQLLITWGAGGVLSKRVSLGTLNLVNITTSPMLWSVNCVLQASETAAMPTDGTVVSYQIQRFASVEQRTYVTGVFAMTASLVDG
jgi:hypothetical protein